MKKVLCVFFVLFSLLLFEGRAFAYLDPGLSTMVLQLVLGGLAGAALIIKIFYRHFLNLFTKSLKKEKQTVSDK